MESTAAAESKEFVLCFDGTGYTFRGDNADSNVLKIYRVSDHEHELVPLSSPYIDRRC